MGHYVGVSGTLFWVGGGSLGIILGDWGEWGWVGHYFGCVGVSGCEWGWVHCLIMPMKKCF